MKTDHTVELRPVDVARTHGDESIITTGLKPGETVVTDGQLRLIPGSRVSVKTGDADKTGDTEKTGS
jgi:multidrug efflux system membrane fusion protein